MLRFERKPLSHRVRVLAAVFASYFVVGSILVVIWNEPGTVKMVPLYLLGAAFLGYGAISGKGPTGRVDVDERGGGG
jgi:hypothetical protein